MDRIAEHHRRSNRPVAFSFTGGEPTQYRDLPQLCRHIKETAWYRVSLMSNGTAPLDYWTAIVSWVDHVHLTHHVATDRQHTRAVIDLLRGHHRTVDIVLAMTPEGFDEQMAFRDALARDGLYAAPQPLYRDHHRRQHIMDYTAEQIAILFPQRHHDIVVETAAGVTTMASSDEVIFRRQNSFTGMQCGIGTDQLVIDQDGAIRGGWCRVGGVLGNVHTGELAFPLDGITCTKETCNNPNDLAVPKWTDER